MKIWQPQFDVKACSEWISRFTKSKIFVKHEQQYDKLSIPFEIELLPNEMNKITATYLDDEETGGLMLCKMKMNENKLRLILHKHFQIRNAVEEYCEGKSRKSSYYPEPSAYLKVLSDNFSNKDSSKILFPIHYHTHPTSDIKEDVRYITTAIKLDLSDGDKNASNNREIKLGVNNLLYVNAILTGSGSENRIVFYGKGITPYDFNKPKAKQFVQGVMDVTEDIEKDGWKIFWRTLIGVGTVATAIYGGPDAVRSLTDTFTDMVNKKEYFGVIGKFKSTIITIPEYKEDHGE